MLISSDVKITAKDIGTLHELLFSDGRYGIVAPILLRRDSCEIELYGAGITKDLRMDKENVGEVVTASLPLSKEVAAVPGGISLAKCEYYQQVGLQDERLFMYSDEVDMGIRMARAGLKAVVTRNAVAWHQHILRKNATWRGGYTEFLMRRNRIYLAYKHFGCLRGLYVFLRQIIRAPRVGVSFYRNGASGHLAYYVLGCMCGLFRIHRMPAMILEGRT